MSTDIMSMYTAQQDIDLLVSQYMQLETGPRDNLVTKKTSTEDRKQTLTDLDSKLSALNTQLERFTDPLTDYFATKLATSSDEDKFTVSVGATGALGNHSISVDRLATSDTRVSKQYTDGDSAAFDAFEAADQNFSVEVGHVDEDGNISRVSIDVTITAATFDQDSEDVLQDIANEINSAMSQAVTDEDIDSDEVMNASVITEESGKSRLVFRSENSGYTYRMDFTDTDGLLADLEVNAASVYDPDTAPTAGGYMVASNELNSSFTIDGLSFSRDSNNVTDAITGVTLHLLDTFSTTETMTITSDSDSVKEEVEGFITAYNEALSFLHDNAEIDPNTYERGALADDLVYRNIVLDMRSIIVDEVSSASSSSYSRLYSVGIEVDSTGALSIGDSEKFSAALEANPSYISDLFSSSDGVATKLEDYLESFISVGGTIDKSQENADSTITSLDYQISFVEDLLASREEQLRADFSQLQESMYQLSSQQSFFSSYLTQ